MSEVSNISRKTIEKLAYLFQRQALLEREVELHRIALGQIKDFVVLSAFQRVAQSSQTKKAINTEDDNNDMCQYITSLDFLAFFRQNNLFYSESECFLLIN